MAEQFITLTNGTIRHQPWYQSVASNDYLVKGSGTAATDTAAIAAAIAAMPSAGGTLWIEGTVGLNAVQNITKPISIRGVDKNAKIEVSDDSTGYTGFRYNPNYDPRTATNYALTAVAAGALKFQTAASLSRGDWVALWSDDDVANSDPHTAGGHYYPMEIHQVNDIAGSDYYFDDAFIDPMSTNAELAILPMLSNIAIADLTVEWVGSARPESDTQFSFLQMLACNNVIIENVHFLKDGPGAININFCGNVNIQGLHIEGQAGRNSWYGVTVGAVNGVKFCDSLVIGTRHAFTTGNGSASGSPVSRWGTCRNVTVQNVTGRATTDFAYAGTRTHVIFDTHREGYGVEFRDCTAILASGDPISSECGFQSRSRGTQFINCRAIDPDGTGSVGTGFRLSGYRNRMTGCLVDGAWKGVDVFSSGTGYDECVVENSIIRNTQGYGVKFFAGNNHEANGNQFWQTGVTNLERACIVLESGTGHKIRTNVMPKMNNLYAVDFNDVVPTTIELSGNVMTGYGSTAITATSDIGITNEIYRDANLFYIGSRQSVHTNVTGSYALDFTTGPTVWLLTLTGDTTPVVTNPLFRGDYTLIVEQDSPERTVTWSGFSFVDGNPTLNAGAGSFTMLRLYFDGINWYSGA